MKNFVPLALGFAIASANCAISQETPDGANRLIHESSPYLLLHAHNPVDWYPWGKEAIEKARREEKPIFLSVGYSTCYWCHVMEEESFSNPEIAALMNAGFVSIKVDREERPDLDDIYMTATQLLTQRGGWPNSVFLTPELKPFFAGTYFPPEDRGGMQGFASLLGRIKDAWSNNREELETSAERIATAMADIAAKRTTPAAAVPPPPVTDEAVRSLKERYDEAWGGFGGAPKFPSPAGLFLLLSRAEGDEEAATMVLESLRKMGRGALYDHVDGGFHRYAVDREWRIPHFEKMLYDNAFLAELMTSAAHSSSDPELERLARGTLEFVLKVLTHPEGGFKSAIDAQTDGHEGAFYIWTREELESVLAEDEFALIAPIFALDGEPNFEEHYYTLYLTDSLAVHAEKLGLTREELLRKMAPILDKLSRVRSKRKFPLVDDKVLTDWNGMMIASMARGSVHLNEPRYLEAADKAASFVLDQLRADDGTLRHAWREGSSKIDAMLDDYAFFMRGLLALYEASEDRRWLDEAVRLADEMETRLRDPNGGYFLSPPHPFLLFQPKSVYDSAIPSGNSIAVVVLQELTALTGELRFSERAQAAIKAFAPEFERYPSAARMLAVAIDRYHQTTGAVRTASAPGGAEGSPSAAGVKALAESVVRVGPLRVTGSGERRVFELELELEEGWHVNANPATLPYLVPTELKGEVREVRYTEGKPFRFSFADQELSVYEGSILISGELGSDAAEVILVYQACDDTRCLAPVEKSVQVRR